MRIRKTLSTAALATAIGAVTGAASAGQIFFDTNGPGNPGGAKLVNVFDWAPGTVLFNDAAPVPNAPKLYDYRAQGSLTGFLLAGGGSVSPTLGTEFTYELVLDSVILDQTVGGNVDAVYALAGTGTFRIFYDDNAATQSNQLAGTGFGDGIKILEGTITLTDGEITMGTDNIGALDQFGANNYPNVTTVEIDGGALHEIEIDFVDEDFFLAGLEAMQVDGDADMAMVIDNFTAFENSNPSRQVVGTPVVWNDNANPNAAQVNDNICALGGSCDILAEGDGRSPFAAVQTPEPSSIAMLGAGLLAMGAVGRRRRSRKD